MSDEEKIEGSVNPEQAEKIKKIIDRTEEVEDLKIQLENEKSEKEQAEEALSLIAEREFKARCKARGWNPDEHTPADFSESAPLSQEQVTGIPRSENPEIKKAINDAMPLMHKEFDYVEQMVQSLQQTSKADSDESEDANSILDVLAVKATKNKSRENFSFDIDPRDLKRLRDSERRAIKQVKEK
jgi:hypothetical protein